MLLGCHLPQSDDEIREMAKQELSDLTNAQENLEKELKVLLLPKDPNDEKNVILEEDCYAGCQKQREGKVRKIDLSEKEFFKKEKYCHECSSKEKYL